MKNRSIFVSILTFMGLLILLMPIIDPPGIDCTGTEFGQELREPPTIRDVSSISTRLTAQSVDKCLNGKVFNLQSYIDTTAGTDNRPVGPAYILDVDDTQPGPVLKILLTNKLDTVDTATAKRLTPYDCHDKDKALCTNLHTHGFHVSPKGSKDPSVVQSDFVFIAISPATQPVQYKFDIPKTHAPGTHWLHAHLHGSTALQVKQGMAGALILKGALDRTLARDYGIEGDKDKIMILAQLEDKGKSLCDPEITTSINGQCLPTITVKSGDIHRWRFIHAGIVESINLVLQHTNGTKLDLHEFARDGITMNGTQVQSNIMLQPGYRSDILIQFPPCSETRCEYDLVDDKSTATNSLNGEDEPRHIIARVIIEANGNPEMQMPPSSLFTNPYRFVCDPADFEACSERLNMEEVWFANIPKEDPKDGTYKTVNDGIYPNTPTKDLTLNTSGTWKLWVGERQTSEASHPFHIHVNPFQVIDNNGFSYWKDTLLVSGSYNKGEANARTVVSRYETFDGSFVLHCHNLPHEDAGMMMQVNINR